MEYKIKYQHIFDEYVDANEPRTKFLFNEVVESANKYKLELADKDFYRLIELKRKDKDINWIMHQMSLGKGRSLVDALVTYITW